MIRINKVFLGVGDANAMAKVSDSVNYQAGELLVTLERYVAGTKTVATSSNTPSGAKSVITFSESVIQTNPGAFSTSQRVYVSTDLLCTSGNYVLTVTNTKTKNVFTATTTAIPPIKESVSLPPICPPHYTVNTLDPNYQTEPGKSQAFINYSLPDKTYYIRFVPNEAIIYQLIMRLHYMDYLNTGPAPAYVDYPFTNQFLKDASMISNSGPYITNTFKGSDFYDSFGASMLKNSRSIADIEKRKAYKIQYIVYSSTQDYADYLEYSAPSLSIAQEKPLYSNFEGKKAIGIFAFRAMFTVEKEMDTDFISEFAHHHSTCTYKFYTNLNDPPSCDP